MRLSERRSKEAKTEPHLTQDKLLHQEHLLLVDLGSSISKLREKVSLEIQILRQSSQLEEQATGLEAVIFLTYFSIKEKR